MLLVAAILKAHQFATEPVFDEAPLGPRPFVLGEVWFEVLLACWMLSGLHRRVTRWAVVGCFGAFAVAALGLALRGAASCGCFGRVHVSPWHTAAFDAAIAVLVWLVPGPRTPSVGVAEVPCRFVAGMSAFVVISAALTVVAAHGVPWAASGHEDVGASPGSRVVLRPHTWVGKKLPIRRYIDLGADLADLSAGRWLIVLFRRDCVHCQKVLPLVGAWAEKSSDMRVALVELPPFGHGTPVESLVRDRASRERLFIRGRLSADRDWFVQTPVLIETTGGIVSRIPPASFLDEAASSRNANVTAGFLD